MIMKLISSNKVDDFNDQVQKLLDDMEKENFILVSTDFKVITNNTINYSLLLCFANSYKEQSKMSSFINLPNMFNL